jgi:hypothetical protein
MSSAFVFLVFVVCNYELVLFLCHFCDYMFRVHWYVILPQQGENQSRNEGQLGNALITDIFL